MYTCGLLRFTNLMMFFSLLTHLCQNQATSWMVGRFSKNSVRKPSTLFIYCSEFAFYEDTAVFQFSIFMPCIISTLLSGIWNCWKWVAIHQEADFVFVLVSLSPDLHEPADPSPDTSNWRTSRRITYLQIKIDFD